MSFPRYPDYKDSGVEWLGEVPGHWSVGPIKRLIREVESGTSVNASDEPAEDGKYGVLKTSCVYTGTFDPDENKTVVDEDMHRVACPVKAGTLIVSRMNTPDLIGAAGLVTQDRENLFLPDRLWQISFSNADARFVHFWTLTSLYRGQVKAVCTGTSPSMKNLGQDQFGSFSFASPPRPEQTQIAAFLDRETAKIDGLVAEQRRLMTLLKEKRQAVISHAVTQGLNPQAPMKPSGIEWLGDVPAHWRVGKCGFYLTILSGYAFPSVGFSEDEKDTKLLRGINVGVSRLKWNETVYWQRSENDGLDVYEMRAGDLVIGMDRPLIGEGMRVAKVKQADLPCLLLQRVASLKTGSNLDADYLLGLLSSDMFVAHFVPDTTGVSVPHISPEQINNFVIPVPPVAEQKAIVEFVDIETAKFDTLTAEAQCAIDLLAERRTALISAAVTGQIDVRGVVALL